MIVCRKDWNHDAWRREDRKIPAERPDHDPGTEPNREPSPAQAGPVFIPQRELSAFALALLARP